MKLKIAIDVRLCRTLWQTPPMNPTLRTDRLELRPMAAQDAEQLHEFWTQPEVRRYLWDGRIITLEQAQETITTSVADFEQNGFGFFVIRKDEEFAGFCGYRLFDGGPDVELLYGILPRFWGEGIVTEAALEVLKFGFESADLERVVAATDTPNQRSVRVLQRLGMDFRERREWHGLDTVFYALERDAYRTAHT